MPKIVKNGLEYSGTPLEEVTAWPPTGDSVQIEQPLMGNTDISEVGDGTVTGAISALNNGLSDLVVTRNYTNTYSVGANASAVASQGGIPALSGYTPVGIITIATGSQDVVVRSFNLNGIYVKNISSTPQNDVTLSYTALYIHQ